MKKIFTIIAVVVAAATTIGCGGKEDDGNAYPTSVAEAKQRLIGTWRNPAFELTQDVPKTFYSTTCDTIKSPQFKPFDYRITILDEPPHLNDTVVNLNYSLFTTLLTSITFSDDSNPDKIKSTFYFQKCDTSFTERLTIKTISGSPDITLSGSDILILDSKECVFIFGGLGTVHLYRANSN
jgi:hypothetical protein